MKIRSLAVLFVSGLATLAAATPSLAHHGRASYTDEIVTLDATVTEFRFINPHVQIYFDITNEAGEVEHWQAELTAPNRLARGGWTKNMFASGDQIQISGRVAKNEGKSVAINQIVMPNGDLVPLRESLD
ncbi:MAG: DUF6152 family protein [Candidatus Rariloculaceae bacterium]